MTPHPTYLVATDLTEHSEPVLQRALALAKAAHAQLDVVHVMAPLPPAAAPWLPRVQSAVAARGGEIEAAAKAGGIHAHFLARDGAAWVEILKLARERDARLIILGSHTHEALKDVMLGNLPQRLARKGERPLLICRGDGKRPWRRALVLVDLSEPSRRALTTALQLLPQDTEVHVLFCYLVPTEIQPLLETNGTVDVHGVLSEDWKRLAAQDLTAFLHHTDLGGRRVIEHLAAGVPARVGLDLAANIDADLIVCGTRGASAVRGLLLGGVAAGVLELADRDVLAVPPPEQRFDLT